MQASIERKAANIAEIARREIGYIFCSNAAFVFFGCFLAAVFVEFFWIDTFFARNLADVRPLFESMPILLAFLVSALTMRMWSEERRSGTLEFLLTAPLSNWELVAGKYLACLFLVAIALILTLPLTASVASLGPLDFGPVWGGYLASLFLASAYASIGLFISSRTDNQVVSLLLSAVVCGGFVLVGSDVVTGLFPQNVADILRSIGSASHFQSVARGVIDLRDFYFYASLSAAFLSLNVLGLEMIRWSANPSSAKHKVWTTVTSLLVLNFFAGNLWLQQCDCPRIDLTQGQIYSISPVTKSYLKRLKQPLLLRAYFSAKTHPALAPLVPRLRDLLKEYALAGKGRVRVEIVDPLEHPELAKEAAQRYGIKPITFQTANKYQAAVTASYFDILVQYGDEYQKLGYKDLLDAKARTEKDIDVELRNPEYDITRAIKMVMYAFQRKDNLFAAIDQNLEFCGYISPDDKLPEALQSLKRSLVVQLSDLQKKSSGKFSYRFVDPDANSGQAAAELQRDFGLKPFVRSTTDPRTFWFYMTVRSKENKDRMFVAGPPADLSASSLSDDLNAGIRKFARDSLKTLAIVEPTNPNGLDLIANGVFRKQYNFLEKRLSQNYNVRSVSLKDGRIPSDIDLVLLVDPSDLKEKELFAVDQYLMRGGNIIICSGSYDCSVFRPLTAKPLKSGLSEWLKHNGIEITQQMVLDKQASPFAMPTTEFVAGYPVETSKVIAYPYFIDIRPDGMNKDSPVTAKLGQVTLTFASPISVSAEAQRRYKVVPLLHSSSQSWTSSSSDLIPNFSTFPNTGFADAGKKDAELLAVSLEGRFDSYFKNKKLFPESSATDPAKNQTAGEAQHANEHIADSGAQTSAQPARLMVFASNSFLTDNIVRLESAALGNHYANALSLIENAVDWSLEDRELMAIRGNGFFTRTLRFKDPSLEVFFEYGNYVFGIFGLLGLWLVGRRLQRRSSNYAKAIVAEVKPSNDAGAVVCNR